MEYNFPPINRYPRMSISVYLCVSKVEMLKLTRIRALRKYEEADNRNNGSAWWTDNRLLRTRGYLTWRFERQRILPCVRRPFLLSFFLSRSVSISLVPITHLPKKRLRDVHREYRSASCELNLMKESLSNPWSRIF